MSATRRSDDEFLRRALDVIFTEGADAMFVMAPDGRFVAGNPALAARTGMPWERLSTMDFDPTVHPEDLPRVREHFDAAAAGDAQRYSSRGIRPDGTVFHARVLNAPVFDDDGAVIGVVGVAHDVDELTGIRSSLERTETRLVAALDGIRDAIVFVDADWRVTFLNATARALIGRGASDLLGSELWELQLPDPEGEAMLREAMRTREPHVSRRFDEQLQRWMEVISFPAGDLLGIQVRDVTEREQARRRILDDSRLLHARSMLMDSARDAIVMRGLGDVIEYANAQARALLDGSGELVGRSLHEVLGLSDERSREIENAIGATGMWEGDLVVPRPDGPRTTESQWVAVDGPDGHPDAVFCILTDVTDRRRQDEMLLRTQRMESIGTLAGGIAHDLNNVLTPLLLSTELLASGEDDPARLRVLEGMRQTVERGSDMIRQVLTFARGVEGERVVVDVGALAQRFSEFCRDTLPKDIVIEAVAEDGLAVVGDPTQLLQVLMNLATNARDAMPAGGGLRLHATGDGERVVIEVADDGVGMPPEVLSRIFEPFFTTKGLGRGTGLGLPLSQAIARTHGGSLEATSHPDQGTVFRLELPRAAAIDDDGSEPASLPQTDLDGLRVLIVDDHDDIVATALLVIDGAGGVALGADSADAARSLLAEHPVDVVVTDLVMPGTTGRRFLDLLAAEHPQLPVVTMSGVPEQGADAARRPNVKGVLDKPFTSERLLDAIQTAAGRA